MRKTRPRIYRSLEKLYMSRDVNILDFENTIIVIRDDVEKP